MKPLVTSLGTLQPRRYVTCKSGIVRGVAACPDCPEKTSCGALGNMVFGEEAALAEGEARCKSACSCSVNCSRAPHVCRWWFVPPT